MIRLNPQAITATTLGAISIYAATGRKIPEPLLIFSILSSTVAFIDAATKTVIVEETDTNKNIMGDCPCVCPKNALQQYAANKVKL